MFDLTSEEARLLLEISLLATGQNRFQSATAILMAVDAFRTNHVSVDVAKAVLALSQQQFQQGLDYLDQIAIPRHPESAMLKAFRGLALLRLRRPVEARTSLQEAIDGTDDAAAALAKSLMDEI